jgi:hypothetical protein
MPFNYLLTNLLVDVPEAIGAIFLDHEGETVDFVTRHGEPFDLKVEGAYHGIFTRKLGSAFGAFELGSLESFVVESTELATLTQLLPAGYYIVLVARRPLAQARARHHLRRTATALAREIE